MMQITVRKVRLYLICELMHRVIVCVYSLIAVRILGELGVGTAKLQKIQVDSAYHRKQS